MYFKVKQEENSLPGFSIVKLMGGRKDIIKVMLCSRKKTSVN